MTMLPGILLFLSVFAATIPYILLVLFIWWMDRYEREPFGYVVLSTLWGAIGAIIIGVIFSLILMIPASMIVGKNLADLFGTILFAPIAEEISKGIFILIILFSLQFDNATDGFVYGAASGLGFAMTENFLYFSQSVGNLEGWIIIVVLRTLFTGIMHMVTCAIFGAAVGYVKYNKSKAKKLLIPLLGLGIGMVIHSIWNITAVWQSRDPNSYPLAWGILLLFIALTTIIVLFLLSLSHERKVIIKYLTAEAETGLLPKEHIYFISNFMKRNRQGWIHPSIRKRYIDAAVHLAFRQDQLEQAGNPKKIGLLKQDIEKLRGEIKKLLGKE